VTTDVASNLELTPLSGRTRTIAEWTTNFHLALVVIDPFTLESSWILNTASRILERYAEADVRIAFLVTASVDEAKQFLGPLAERFLVFADPQREAVKAFALESLPAFVHINQHHQVEASAEGWTPEQWRAVATNLSDRMGWTIPIIPENRDPSPFVGSPSLG
jgi:Mg/Co/Ni transporter MgtE